MNPDLSTKALNKIESLCTRGCTEVNELLLRARNGDEINELSDLDTTEAQLVVEELGKIMAVYDNGGSEPSTDR